MSLEMPTFNTETQTLHIPKPLVRSLAMIGLGTALAIAVGASYRVGAQTTPGSPPSQPVPIVEPLRSSQIRAGINITSTPRPVFSTGTPTPSSPTQLEYGLTQDSHPSLKDGQLVNILTLIKLTGRLQTRADGSTPITTIFGQGSLTSRQQEDKKSFDLVYNPPLSRSQKEKPAIVLSFTINSEKRMEASQASDVNILAQFVREVRVNGEVISPEQMKKLLTANIEEQSLLETIPVDSLKKLQLLMGNKNFLEHLYWIQNPNATPSQPIETSKPNLFTGPVKPENAKVLIEAPVAIPTARPDHNIINDKGVIIPLLGREWTSDERALLNKRLQQVKVYDPALYDSLFKTIKYFKKGVGAEPWFPQRGDVNAYASLGAATDNSMVLLFTNFAKFVDGRNDDTDSTIAFAEILAHELGHVPYFRAYEFPDNPPSTWVNFRGIRGSNAEKKDQLAATMGIVTLLRLKEKIGERPIFQQLLLEELAQIEYINSDEHPPTLSDFYYLLQDPGVVELLTNNKPISMKISFEKKQGALNTPTQRNLIQEIAKQHQKDVKVLERTQKNYI